MKKISIMALIILTAISGYAIAQMGMGMMRGGHMMGGMHDHAPILYNSAMYTEDMRISRGGQLYDNWWKATVDTEKPDEDHPLWKLQDTNKRSGYSTYRCKECHGWDYRGKDGAYSKGSHFTGFRGVIRASSTMSQKELEGVLKGSTNSQHDFSKYLKNPDIADLALFLKNGIIDTDKYIDTKGNPLVADINRGEYLFNANCTVGCHGRPGTMINFGDDEKPEYVGTVAGKNPWEFIHKVRNGQPGTKMPSALINKWSRQDIQDILAYARTLPRNYKDASKYGRMMTGTGFHQNPLAQDYRGFGPLVQ